MAVLKRQKLQGLLADAAKGEMTPVYLVFGERFLCRDAIDDLIDVLLPDERQREMQVKSIDGDREDPVQTLNLLRTYSLFGGRQIIRVMDSRLLYSKSVAKTFWDKALKAHASGDFKRAARSLARMLGLAGMNLADWEGEGVAEVSAGRWQELFGFARPQEVSWVRDVVAVDVPPPSVKSRGNVTELFIEAFEAGIPPGNTLILMAEAADKRKKLYKYIAEKGIVLDLSVESGGSSAARKSQEAVLKDLVGKTLAGFNKKISPGLLPLLLDRIGFHPVAVVMETEKLALYAGNADTITREDIDAIVGRTREEAIFEFTEAYAEGNSAGALIILGRLLESGMHPLAVLAGLRNHIRKLLVARSFEELPEPAYTRGMAYPVFQKGYLAGLKEGRGEWPPLLSGHPYVLYKIFRQAEKRSLAGLQEALAGLLEAEFRLKGSGVAAGIVLENFLFQTMNMGRKEETGHTEVDDAAG